MKKSFIAVFSAAAMVVSTIAPTVAYASVFADINNVPWSGAAQYIDEAYSLGLMAGYVENGQRYCKAKNNVTYCEAVQLMYSIMSGYSGTSVSSSVVSKWTSTMSSNKIPSWAYNAVAYALENSILSTNDLTIFMSNSGGQNNARREDVAVIFGKALAKKFSIASNPTISYADKANVSTTSVPYLELLNRLNIMVGDSNNNFNPKVNINRAEMAVLASKTYNKFKEGGTTGGTASGQIIQYSGTVTSKTSNGTGYTLAVTGKSGGVNVTYTFTTTASTTVLNGSTSSTVAKINTGDTIVAVCNGTVASTILITATGSTSSSTASGTISALTTSKIALKSSSKTTEYEIKDASSVTVTIDGSTSSVSSLKSKYSGGTSYTATVTLDGNGYVTKIVAKKGSSSSSDDTTVSSITSSYIKLKSGDRYSFIDDEDDLIIKLKSTSSWKTLDDIDELVDKFKDMDDDEIMTVELDLNRDDEIKEVKATIETKSSSSSSIKGTISDYDEDDAWIKVSSKKYYFPDDDDDVSSMKFDGSSKSTIKKFMSAVDSAIDDDDSVYVEITLKSSKIYKIVATVGESVSGELKSFDKSDKEIKVGSKTYDYTSSTEFSITDGSSTISSASDLDDAVNDDDKVIEVTVVVDSDDKVTSVSGYVKEVEGEIKTYKHSSTDTSCYIVLDNSSSAKYYFLKTTDFSGDCDDTDDLNNAVNDDDETVEVTLTLNSSGKITDIDSKY